MEKVTYLREGRFFPGDSDYKGFMFEEQRQFPEESERMDQACTVGGEARLIMRRRSMAVVRHGAL
jgi:hypothetical protein